LAEPAAGPHYQVTVKPSGESFDCPAHKSILNAAHAADILISYSCRSGQCGSCLGKVLRGKVEYFGGLPDAISEQEVTEGYVLFCSAFAVSDLTIELIQPDFHST
jgi:CDP-4-dehydro-6-deoxyglucose reductase